MRMAEPLLRARPDVAMAGARPGEEKLPNSAVWVLNVHLRYRRGLWRGIVFCGVLGVLFSCAARPPAGAAAPLNHTQFIGSHNSYKQAIDTGLLQLLAADSPALAASLEYEHPELSTQLDLGLRSLELDVFYDPQGGLLSQPLGLTWVSDARPLDVSALQSPGFKVLHVQDIDFRSHCLRFEDCLITLRQWSRRNPRHSLVVITVNAKDAVIDRPGFAVPEPFDRAAWVALDQVLRTTLGDLLVTPDDVRSTAKTLPEAIAGGWPSWQAMQGRFMFVLDEVGEKQAQYIAGHPALRGRAMFVNAPKGTPESAVLIINDPITRFDEIQDAVRQGYLVRTRADADTEEARRGDYHRMRRAFASGAHIISTDYYQADVNFGHAFQVQFPDASYLRCNPVLAMYCGMPLGPAARLDGSQWRLTDVWLNAQRSETPPESERPVYGLSLNADGHVQLRLDCNRGRATWHAEPDATGLAGDIRFSAPATTRAWCESPPWGAAIAQDLMHLHRFELHNNQLQLMSHAGERRYIFEPDTETAVSTD